ncbi:MAG: NIL domain-containing protein, partial [Sphaerochaeta sp.]|nr:NIL domain-containing protein [Sphaerochaeta sp.]
QPILSKISRQVGVDFNIRAGGVQKVGDIEIGTMLVDISGSDEEKKRAIEALRQMGVVVEEEAAE